jgi:hypothetical protein
MLNGVAATSPDSALVIDQRHKAVISIDGKTGDRRILSNTSHGDGPDFVTPQDITAGSGAAFVVDSGLVTWN